MKNYWVNCLSYGRSVADVYATCEEEALEIALRNSPPDPSGEFQGDYRENYEESPCFVTEERPTLACETSPVTVNVQYPPRRHPEDRLFHVRQNNVWLDSVVVTASDPDEALSLYREACKHAADSTLLAEAESVKVFTGPIVVTPESEAISSEEQSYENCVSTQTH